MNERSEAGGGRYVGRYERGGKKPFSSPLLWVGLCLLAAGLVFLTIRLAKGPASPQETLPDAEAAAE